MADVNEEIERLIALTIKAMSNEELAKALVELGEDALSKIFSALPEKAQKELTGGVNAGSPR